MGKIHVLPFEVANLIAAGEVVDRPASVIKELMENSIDAGATSIVVEIRQGGIAFMRVSDNGCGISREDLPVALRRHATSKIQDRDDLAAIMTLGFRGEALAAIAAVSDIRIFSKPAGEAVGALLTAPCGEEITVEEQGCSNGTTVIVENLFARVPARRKFLKKDVTESMAVSANVEKVALSHPEIAFRLIVDGNVRMETEGDGNLLHTIHSLFGKELAARMLKVESQADGVAVSGYVGRSDNYKANRNQENFFLNGRFVKSKTIMAAVEQAYTSYMPPERFPCCVLCIELDPSRVDVNVHPSKLEVKFSNEKAVFEAVYYAVRTVLESNVTRPNVNLDSALKKNPFAYPGGKISQATAPVETERPGSLARRQLSYDTLGTIQHQPQSRMTSEEYLRTVAGIEKAAPRPADDRTEDKKTVGRQTQPAVPPVTPSAEKPTAPVSKKEEMPQGAIEVPLHMDVKFPPSVDPNFQFTVPEAGGIAKLDAVGTAPAAERTTPAKQPESADSPAPVAAPEPKTSAPAELPPYRILGVAFRCYVLVETGEKLLLIDQHAAHERILFEELKAGLAALPVTSQMMMLPVEAMLTAAEVSALQEFDGELQKIGFKLRYAKNTVLADAIPQGVEPGAVGAMLGTMAGRLIDNTGSVKLTRDILFEKALYQAACKAAIKGGREYSPEEIKWLVKKLMELPDITFCPHGRPVAMELSKRVLDRQFDRTGF